MSGYVDYYNGKNVLFDGIDMVELPTFLTNKETIFGNKILNNVLTNDYLVKIFVGVLHLSSKRIYTTGKSGIIRKEFTPFFKFLPKILVKTKKIDLSSDVCVIVKLDYVENNIMYCDVVQYLGEFSAENDITILKALATCHWSKKLDSTFSSLLENDLTPNRKDLTNLEIYSVDPVGCDDIDDAIHCVETSDGYDVGIHIADVTSYIKEGSAHDEELSKRIETVYFDSTLINKIDMIPSALSVSHMSLKQNENKRSFSVILKLDKSFKIYDTSFEKTVIKVKKNLSYEEFQSTYNDGHHSNLKLLYDIGIELKKDIHKSFNETEEYDSHQMVAVYMIYANKLVAERIATQFPDEVLLRTQHESKYDIANVGTSGLQKKYENALYERAFYKIGTLNSDHHNMGLKYYTHFTSPIRRYADVLVHRQLWNVINNNEIAEISCKVIFGMNTYSKIYKIIQRYSKILDFVSSVSTDINEMEFDAYIISFHSGISNEINCRIHIPDIGVDHDVTIINKKFEHIIKILRNLDSVTLTNIHTNENICIHLFQKIRIKLAITRKSLNKINIALLNPNINFLLSTDS